MEICIFIWSWTIGTSKLALRHSQDYEAEASIEGGMSIYTLI
ncbi:hypothetical protein PEC301296_34330 [Pectobacterium carotovorum subsp. carotovorum]|nr:hypothetical protein KCQ_20794 [Pectobacterium atrosepticum ICMP 1526]POW28592.1 hypothetical protein PB72LOC_02187 [Pectobacterium atrosepticum]GKV87122.1 hypothetical protein PEC301296_34330 [Pectobacterium carotovorum subsp. carotovorum]